MEVLVATAAQQKVAIVTGAARGIGAGVARHLAAGSWRVVAADVDTAAVGATAGSRVPTRVSKRHFFKMHLIISQCDDFRFKNKKRFSGPTCKVFKLFDCRYGKSCTRWSTPRRSWAFSPKKGIFFELAVVSRQQVIFSSFHEFIW
jgi:hypothetical protein